MLLKNGVVISRLPYISWASSYFYWRVRRAKYTTLRLYCLADDVVRKLAPGHWSLLIKTLEHNPECCTKIINFASYIGLSIFCRNDVISMFEIRLLILVCYFFHVWLFVWSVHIPFRRRRVAEEILFLFIRNIMIFDMSSVNLGVNKYTAKCKSKSNKYKSVRNVNKRKWKINSDWMMFFFSNNEAGFILNAAYCT